MKAQKIIIYCVLYLALSQFFIISYAYLNLYVVDHMKNKMHRYIKGRNNCEAEGIVKEKFWLHILCKFNIINGYTININTKIK